jgi:hypothetical protein
MLKYFFGAFPAAKIRDYRSSFWWCVGALEVAGRRACVGSLSAKGSKCLIRTPLSPPARQARLGSLSHGAAVAYLLHCGQRSARA